MNSELITKDVINGRDYFTTVRRGVEYCAYFQDVIGEWFVSSRRLGLGRFHVGGGKYLKNVEDCKAFAALPALLKMNAI